MPEYIYEIEDDELDVDEIFIGWIRRHSEQLVRCKDCKYFELNHWDKVYSVTTPIITAHEICKKWGDGCKTSAEGFCFMGEKNEERTDG